MSISKNSYRNYPRMNICPETLKIDCEISGVVYCKSFIIGSFINQANKWNL